MHAIVAQGGSQSKLIHFAYITPIGPTKIRQLVDASKLILKKYLKKKTNKQKVSSQLIFCFLSRKTNPTLAKGNSLWPLAIFHLSHFLPLSLRPKMSPFHSHGWRGDLSPKCARLHGGSDAKHIPLQADCLFQGQKPQIRWVFTGNV